MEDCKILIRTYHFNIGFFIVLFLTVGCQTNNQKSNLKVSEFGKYEGYSEEMYDSWERNSKYIKMNDGVKLAMDIIRPIQNDRVVVKELPAVWVYYRYHRAVEKDGKVLSLVDRLPPLQTLIKHGYVIVVVDARGSGASFGSNESKGPNSLQEAQHTYQITEWIAAQDWCDGNVGMFGHSYSGNVQFLAVAQAPTHLKAVFPSGASFDIYEILYSGGAFKEDFAKVIRDALHYWDIEADAVPVDSDSNGLLLEEANLEHRKNVDPFEFFTELPYRDSRYKDYAFWLQGNPWVYMSDCNVSQIPVYQWIGWKDFLIKDALQWHVNLKGPSKLSIGWWSHDNSSSYELLGIEQLRWFDYWLKGIDNGIMDESAIHYIYIDDPDSTFWYQVERWPLPEYKPREFYFVQGGSDSTQPGYDGLLLERPDLKEKWQKEIPFPDSKTLTFTTQPLEKELFVVGHPIVTLYITTISEDVDIYITLQDIDKSDSVSQVSKGILRASHRKESTPSFNNMGLPFHRHFKEDVLPIPSNQPFKLAFDLLPIARVFGKGHRIRLTVDYSNTEWDVLSEEKQTPEVKIFFNNRMACGISLPIIKKN